MECFANLTSLNVDLHTDHWPDFFVTIDNTKYKTMTTIDVIQINLMIYMFQVICKFHKHLSDMYTDNKPLDHFVDHAVERIKYMYTYGHKVRDLIFMSPLIRHKLDFKRVSLTGTQILNERDRHPTPLPFVDDNSLTQKEINVFNNSWCISDRVEITNSKLNVKPYRCEPP